MITWNGKLQTQKKKGDIIFEKLLLVDNKNMLI